MKKKIVIISGAGLDAESGVPTFRDSDGLWENHNIEEVCTLKGFKNNPEKVLGFYNMLRNKLHSTLPNEAHIYIAELETQYDVYNITQNVSDLLQRAGSTNVIHLHGELLKSRSTKDPSKLYSITEDLKVGDKCELGSQLRPHIVWFGENIYNMGKSHDLIHDADIVIIIGTSLQVFPASDMVDWARTKQIYYVDPGDKPLKIKSKPYIKHIKKIASEGMLQIKKELLK